VEILGCLDGMTLLAPQERTVAQRSCRRRRVADLACGRDDLVRTREPGVVSARAELGLDLRAPVLDLLDSSAQHRIVGQRNARSQCLQIVALAEGAQAIDGFDGV
jgi:hypothetical protein